MRDALDVGTPDLFQAWCVVKASIRSTVTRIAPLCKSRGKWIHEGNIDSRRTVAYIHRAPAFCASALEFLQCAVEIPSALYVPARTRRVTRR